VVGVRSAPAGLSGESAGVVGGNEVAEARVGRISLKSRRQASISARASARELNRVSFSSSSRSLPLKLSLKPFCWGFPGAM
jgi:hypothetical protein